MDENNNNVNNEELQDDLQNSQDNAQQAASNAANRAGSAVQNKASQLGDRAKNNIKSSIKEKITGEPQDKKKFFVGPEQKARGKMYSAKGKAQEAAGHVVEGAGKATEGVGSAVHARGSLTRAEAAGIKATGDVVGAALAALGVGVAVKETTDAIAKSMDEAGKSMQQTGNDIKEKGRDLSEKGKQQIEAGKHNVKRGTKLQNEGIDIGGASANISNVSIPGTPGIPDFGDTNALKSKLKAMLRKAKSAITSNDFVKWALIIAGILIAFVFITIMLISSIVYRGKYEEGSLKNAPYVVTANAINRVEIAEDGKGGFTYVFVDEDTVVTGLEDCAKAILKTLEDNNSTSLSEMGSKKKDKIEFLKTLIQAEFVTQYPDISESGEKKDTGSSGEDELIYKKDSELQGNIKIQRKDRNGEITELKFIDEKSFDAMMAEKDPEVMNYFTLKKNPVDSSDLFDDGEDDYGTTGGSSGGHATSLVGSDNAEKIWNFFIDSGFTEEATAGLMGNLMAESGLKSVRVQGDYNHGNADQYSADYTARVDSGEVSEYNFVYNGPGGGGYGLAQWTSSDRKQGLYDYAQSKGASIGDLQMQLEYLYDELQSKYSSIFSQLTSSTDMNAISDLILTEFERPKDISGNRPVRRNNAKDIYNQFAGSHTKGSGDTSSDSDSSSEDTLPTNRASTTVTQTNGSASNASTTVSTSTSSGGASATGTQESTTATTDSEVTTTVTEGGKTSDTSTAGVENGATATTSTTEDTTNSTSGGYSSRFYIVVASIKTTTVTEVEKYDYDHTNVISTNSGTTGSGSQSTDIPTGSTRTTTTVEYIPVSYDYQEAMKDYTTYFDFLWSILTSTSRRDLVMEWAKEVLNSKVEITVFTEPKTKTKVKTSALPDKSVYKQDGSTVYEDVYNGHNVTTTTVKTVLSRAGVTVADVWYLDYKNEANTYKDYQAKTAETIREKVEPEDNIVKIFKKEDRIKIMRQEAYLVERMLKNNPRVAHLYQIYQYVIDKIAGVKSKYSDLSQVIDLKNLDLSYKNSVSSTTALMYNSINLSDDQKKLLAQAVEQIAGSSGADFETKKAIASTILNRVMSSEFPNTVEEVLSQSGQFPNLDYSSLSGVTPSEETTKAVDEVLSSGDSSNKSVYMATPSQAESLGFDKKYSESYTSSDNSFKFYTTDDVSKELERYEVVVDKSSNSSTMASDVAQRIVDWAESQVGNSTFYNSHAGKSQASKNYCAAFVKCAYYEAGLEYIGGNAGDLPHPNPIEYNADGSVDWSNIPVGAIIVSRGTPVSGVLYGHVCLYVGNGYIIEAGGSTIKKSPIDQSFGAGNCGPFLGWGFATNDQDAAMDMFVDRNGYSDNDSGDSNGYSDADYSSDYDSYDDEGGGVIRGDYPEGWTRLTGCGNWGSTSGTGVQGIYTAGDKSYNVYCQGAGPWAYTPLNEPSKTVMDAGCGITSVSIVLTGLGFDVTPAAFKNQKSAGDQYVEQHLREYGVNYKKLSSMSQIIDELKKGNPVIYHVRGGYVGDRKYSGHYVALLGLNSEGEIFLADPGSTHNSGYFDKSKFSGLESAYAVWK